MVSRHNCLRDLVLEFCRCAHQVVRVEKGSGLTPDHSRTRPADILVLDWDISLKQACQGGGGGGGGGEQQYLRQRCKNREPMITSALSWDGLVSHLL